MVITDEDAYQSGRRNKQAGRKYMARLTWLLMLSLSGCAWNAGAGAIEVVPFDRQTAPAALSVIVAREGNVVDLRLVNASRGQICVPTPWFQTASGPLYRDLFAILADGTPVEYHGIEPFYTRSLAYRIPAGGTLHATYDIREAYPVSETARVVQVSWSGRGFAC